MLPLNTDTLAVKPFCLQNPLHEAKRQALLQRCGGYSTGMCQSFTSEFATAFPELRRVPGFYRCRDGWNGGEHWWLVDLQGAVIDPTADQFPDQGQGTYEAYSPAKHKVPKGTCMCCGGAKYASEGSSGCSEECDQELAREYGWRMQGGPYECDFEDAQTDAELMAMGLKFAKIAALIEMSAPVKKAEPACA